MPPSQFVTARRLRPLLAYFAIAFVTLLTVDWAVGAMGLGGMGRQVLVVGWLVIFPAGAWWVWRRSPQDDETGDG